ncbi:MAG: tetratricopeptide repeat protein [Candidatus Sumerlaeia bacterium]|nr:tetratricopeptide repeat protein [Candidatus Sumerlaeia bacterium]
MRAKELYSQARKIGEDKPEGLKLLISVVELDPENISYRYELARAYYFNKDLKSAVAQCAEVLKRDPRHADALTVMGSAYFYLEDYQKAIEAQEEALKIKPNNFYAQFNLAHVCMYVDKARARAEFQKFIEMAENEPSQKENVKRARECLKGLE